MSQTQPIQYIRFCPLPPQAVLSNIKLYVRPTHLHWHTPYFMTQHVAHCQSAYPTTNTHLSDTTTYSRQSPPIHCSFSLNSVCRSRSQQTPQITARWYSMLHPPNVQCRTTGLSGTQHVTVCSVSWKKG